jgi:hypothetical protein
MRRPICAEQVPGTQDRPPAGARKGALKNLGYKIGRSTIKRILREHGIDPALIRGKRIPWSKFIKAHMGAIVGMDFFTQARVPEGLGLA